MENEGLINTVRGVFPQASIEQVDDIILRASNKPGDISKEEVARISNLFKTAHEHGKTLCSMCEHEATKNFLCDDCYEQTERQASRA